MKFCLPLWEGVRGQVADLRMVGLAVVVVAASVVSGIAAADNPDNSRILEVIGLLDPGVPGSWGDTLNNIVPDPGGAMPSTWADGADLMNQKYSADSTLLPTVKPGLWLKGAPIGACPSPVPGHIVDYFRCYFLKFKPRLVLVNPQHVVMLGTDGRGHQYASNQGLYVFELHDDGNGNAIVPARVVYARYTFVYRKRAGYPWALAEIVQHHSSEEPARPLPPDKAANIRQKLIKWGEELRKNNYIEDGHRDGTHANLAAHAAAMAGQYLPEATLLPTLAPGLHRQNAVNRPKIVDYFKDFLLQRPELIHVDPNDDPGFLGDIAFYQGLYTFRMHRDKEGNPWQTPDENGLFSRDKEARFTFVYRKGHQPDWTDAKIRQHHSSAKPTRNGDHEDSCPSDFDGDGLVGINDLLFLLATWGMCPP